MSFFFFFLNFYCNVNDDQPKIQINKFKFTKCLNLLQIIIAKISQYSLINTSWWKKKMFFCQYDMRSRQEVYLEFRANFLGFIFFLFKVIYISGGSMDRYLKSLSSEQRRGRSCLVFFFGTFSAAGLSTLLLLLQNKITFWKWENSFLGARNSLND